MTEPRRTHYDVLGLRPGASAASIREAYLNLARLVHPDRHQHSSAPEQALAERRMREVTEAWAVLGDPASRARYDREHASTSRPRRPADQKTGDQAPSGAARHGGPQSANSSDDAGDAADEHDGVEVSWAVYHLLTKGPVLALIALAFLILVFTAYARPSGTDPTTPGSTSPVFATPSTSGMDPNR